MSPETIHDKLRLYPVIASIVFFCLVKSAFAAGPVTSPFTATGSGVSAGALSTCSQCTTGHTCICVPLSGTGKASVIGTVNWTTTVVLDETNPEAGDCIDTYGTVTLTAKSSSKNALSIDYHGFECSVGTNYTLNGTYVINPANSTGKFLNYKGSGNLAGSEDSNSDILGNLSGTIQTP